MVVVAAVVAVPVVAVPVVAVARVRLCCVSSSTTETADTSHRKVNSNFVSFARYDAPDCPSRSSNT